MITSMTHLAIDTKDMEKSLKFYREVFGFKKIFELSNPETGDPWIVYIQVAKGQFLELFYTELDKKEIHSTDVGFSHICFCVDSVEEIAKHIREAGYILDIPPCRGCDNNLQTWVRDPNGIRIELMEVSPDSPHAQFM